MISRRSWRKGYAAVALGFLIALASLGSALAHANLVRSDPPAGTSLAVSPTRVQLWFSEDIEPSFSDASVLDVNRQRVDLADSHVAPDDSRSLILGVKPGLTPGVYVVAWKTQSKVDGHVVRGTVPFGVGTSVVAPDAANQGAPQGAVSGTPLEMALRWLILFSASTLVGSFSYWVLQAKPLGELESSGNPDLPPTTHLRSVQATIAWVAFAAFLLGNLALLVLQTATASDVYSIDAIGAPLARVLVSTQFGGIWIARVILAILLGQLLIARRRAGPAALVWDRIAIAVGLGLLASITLTSHSASVSFVTPIGILPVGVVVDWFHLIGVTAWVGGLAQLTVTLIVLGKNGTAVDRSRFLGGLVPRFSILAGSATAIIAVTGLAEALIHVGTIDNLLGTGYGQALGVKLILGAPLAALAVVNHFVIRPALERVRRDTGPRAVRQAIDLAGVLRGTVRFELLLVAGMIAAVGVMTSISPAQQIGASSTPGPLSLQGAAGNLTVAFGLGPGRPGSNRYTVDLRDASGQTATNVERVALRFTFLDSDLGMSESVLQPGQNGQFAGQSSDLAVAGRWQTEVVVRQTGQGDDRASFTFDVTPTGARTGNQPILQVTWLFWAGLALAIVGAGAFGRGVWLRQWDVRRAAIVGVCGLGIMGTGGFFAGQDVLLARDVAASQLLAESHPATAASVANGALIFRQDCVTCHGLDGRGNGPLAPTLNPRPADLVVHVPLHPDSDLFGWISGGFPGSAMPAFRDQLTEQQRWDVLNYLKSLSSGGPAVAATSPATPPSTQPTVVAAVQTTSVAASTPSLPTASIGPTATSGQPPTAAPAIDDSHSPKMAGDLQVALQVTPRIYQPADLEVDVTGADGKPATGVQRVDLETAMVGMNHGARGVAAKSVGPGRYAATAMVFAMQGPWWLAVRIERSNGVVSSTVFQVAVPKDTSNGVVSAMAERPPGSPQIEDIAVYPGEISPPDIAVVAGRAVRLEVFYVDKPVCGSVVRVVGSPLTAPVTSDGLAELTFVPSANGRDRFSCDPSGLMVSPG